MINSTIRSIFDHTAYIAHKISFIFDFLLPVKLKSLTKKGLGSSSEPKIVKYHKLCGEKFVKEILRTTGN